jgi:uncharacterized membrane protein YdbT with pleckstrin-like domain
LSYIDKNLIQGESVIYRGSLTRLPYGWAIALAVVTIATAVFRNFFPAGHRWLPAAVLAVATIVAWSWARIRVGSAEFAVTNRRVMIKLGVMQRRTVETMLSKVEGVAVDQSLTGRIFDYGTVTVTGTGGTRETFEDVAAPLEFRRQVQGQLARIEDERLAAPRTAPTPPPR